MDISTQLGDLSLLQTKEDEFDLALSDEVYVRRALETPQTYLSEWVLQPTLSQIDERFGNPIYLKVSEPLTLSWLTEVQSDVVTALSFLEEQIVVNYVNVSSSLDSVSIEVSYSLNNQNQITQFEVNI